MRRILLLALMSLTACTSLDYGLGINIGSDGTTVSPSVTGTSGNASITIGG